MYDIVVAGVPTTIANINAIPERVMKRLAIVIPQLTQTLNEGEISKIGITFKPGTGRLAGSLRNDTRSTANQVMGRVFTQGVPYAAAQEWGVTFTHPGSSKPQSFVGRDGKRIFTQFTKPHTITLPERSYARSTLADQRLAIVGGVRGAMIEEFTT